MRSLFFRSKQTKRVIADAFSPILAKQRTKHLEQFVLHITLRKKNLGQSVVNAGNDGIFCRKRLCSNGNKDNIIFLITVAQIPFLRVLTKR